MASILVPDYMGQQVIAGIRALTKQGDSCDVAWEKQLRHYFKSKAIRRIYTITASGFDDAQYVSDIVNLCQNYSYDLILPFGLKSYYAISKHADILSKHTQFLVAGFETFKIANDKLKTAEFCQKVDIDTPTIFTNYSDNDIPAIANEVKYPVVIKARSGSGIHQGLRYANNKDELIRYYNEIASNSSDGGASNFESPMIQEFIPGYIHDACTLTNQGDVVTVLTQIRKIMYPIYGGVGAVNVTTDEPKLSAIAIKLLESLNWHGPAQIEFKYDERDGKYKLIEINPKLWGTVDLSIKVGINFPAMIRDIVLGEKVERNKNYPVGVRYKFIFPQAILAYMQIFQEFGFQSLYDRNDYSKTFCDFDFSDPKPELLRVVSALKSVFSGRTNSPNSNLPKELINKLS